MNFKMTENTRHPALLLDWLTPAYDLFVRLLLRERQLKRDLIALSDIKSGQRVLDIGSGTGTLAIMIKQNQPHAWVTCLDADRSIVTIARKKASRSGVEIPFELGDASLLPHPDALFDRVFSTLVLSLLSSKGKQRAVQEAYRVLRSGGKLHIADFGPPARWWEYLIAHLVRRFKPINDNLEGRLPVLLRLAGFEHVQELARFTTLFGTISILSGQK
jgi:ubiquinone/menaquinone biosynthesis C-methylase UbiE